MVKEQEMQQWKKMATVAQVLEILKGLFFPRCELNKLKTSSLMSVILKETRLM